MDAENDLMAFKQEVAQAIEVYESSNQHIATRTRNMIAKCGEIKALARLMLTPDLQQGFQVLRDTNQLRKTFEAIVTRYPHLFAVDVVEAARWRLMHPYDLL